MSQAHKNRHSVIVKKVAGAVFVVLALVAPFITTTEARGIEKTTPLEIKLEKDKFLVLLENGDTAELINMKDTAAEDIFVGFSRGTDAFYVRTVNHFSGAKENPLFNIDLETIGDNPELIDFEENAYVQEFIPKDKLPQVESSEFELGTVISVGTDFITVAWNAPKGTESVSVLFDGRPAETNKNGFVISGLRSNSKYHLDIEFSKIKGEKLETIRQDFHVVHTLPKGLGDPSLDNRIAEEIARFSASSKAKAVRMVTFLKNDYYPAGWMSQVGCGTNQNWYFKGDNRDYYKPAGPVPLPTHPSFRTGLEVVAELDAPSALQGVYINKMVGTTKRYDEHKNFVDSATASSNGIVVQNPTVSADNYVKYGVSHEIGDPFCWIGKIRYSLPLVEVYKSGTVSLSGSRQPIPAFEFYASFIPSSGASYWATLFRGHEGDLVCLLGICPSQNISQTHSTW